MHYNIRSKVKNTFHCVLGEPVLVFPLFLFFISATLIVAVKFQITCCNKVLLVFFLRWEIRLKHGKLAGKLEPDKKESKFEHTNNNDNVQEESMYTKWDFLQREVTISVL